MSERSHPDVSFCILAGSGGLVTFHAIDEVLQLLSSLKCLFDDEHSLRSYRFDAHDVVYQFVLHVETEADGKSKKGAGERGEEQQRKTSIPERSMGESEEDHQGDQNNILRSYQPVVAGIEFSGL